jgi:hypothetical protein
MRVTDSRKMPNAMAHVSGGLSELEPWKHMMTPGQTQRLVRRSTASIGWEQPAGNMPQHNSQEQRVPGKTDNREDPRGSRW